MKKMRILGLLACSTLFAANANADFVFTAAMSGASESPGNTSTASGFTSVIINDDRTSMTVHVEWTGLTGGAPSAGHIHCCTAVGTNIGVAVGFPGLPALTSGVYNQSFDLLSASIYTTGFLNNFGGGTAAGARDALFAGLTNGTAYSNLHNTMFPGGEIRGLLAPSPVPLPAAAWLLVSGIGVLGGGLRARRRQSV